MELLAGFAAIFGLGIFTFLVINSIIGLVCLFLFNLVASLFGMRIDTGCLSSIIVGFFGVPALAVLLIIGLITGSAFKSQQTNKQEK